MALRAINTNRSKMGGANPLSKDPPKAQLEPSKRGVLGEISNKPTLPRVTVAGKKSNVVNFKDVKAKVVTRHTQRPIAAVGPTLRKASTLTAANVNVVPVSHTPVLVTSNVSKKFTIKADPQEPNEGREAMEISAFSTTILPENVEYEDTDDSPVVLSEYVMDIYKYLRQLEVQYPIKCDFLSGQNVSQRMRAVLVDWLTEVHQQFSLLQETLYLTVATVDRFLQVYHTIDRARLQLVGMTCMWVASKYEEMYCPEVGDFVYIAADAYTRSQIMAMECLVLEKLKFSLGRPLPLHFLRRFSKVAQSDPITHTLAKYFLELTLVQYEMCHIPPSLVAASAIFVALWLVGEEKRTVWTPTLEYYSQYSFNQILPIATKMAGYIVNAELSKYESTRRKFATSKLLKISDHPKLQSVRLASIAKGLTTF